MGYMGFTTTKVGKAIQIQSIDDNGDVYVQNVGESAVTLASVYVNGTQEGTVSGDVLPVGKTEMVETAVVFSPGDTVTVKATTTDGNFAELTKSFP
jgi:hypothetical protein